ncbi:MAG: hypothetical protein Q9M92_08505 [Enterobacterales bacterium]|nr:hypothetical protein [Enterobacterales bacterium]
MKYNYGIPLWKIIAVLCPAPTRKKNIFELFPEIDQKWFQHKVDSVFQMQTRAFSIWEQRPYIFKFKNYRPITGIAEYMYPTFRTQF